MCIRDSISHREVLAATRFLDSPDTWPDRLGVDRLELAWGPLCGALVERLALRPPTRTPRLVTPEWAAELGEWGDRTAAWVAVDASMACLSGVADQVAPDSPL
eukprot:7951804-Alexandrium_andersonii.AAC.1